MDGPLPVCVGRSSGAPPRQTQVHLFGANRQSLHLAGELPTHGTNVSDRLTRGRRASKLPMEVQATVSRTPTLCAARSLPAEF